MNIHIPVRHLALLAGFIALAVAVIVWLGVPWVTVVPMALIVLCPLSMIVMMSAMGGHGTASGHHDVSDSQPVLREGDRARP